MRIIPALDLARGHAVKAAGGDRTRYLPLEPVSDPWEVARILLAKAAANAIYVADLDAIQGGTRQDDVLAKLSANTEIWLDCGIRSEADLPLQLGPNIRLVLGTETLQDSTLLLQASAEFGASNVMISLDYRNGDWIGPLSPEAIYQDAFFSGIQTFLILDLHRVGSGSGASHFEGLVRDLRARFPAAAIYPGGGIRNKYDLQALQRAGASGVISTTALLNNELIIDETGQ